MSAALLERDFNLDVQPGLSICFSITWLMMSSVELHTGTRVPIGTEIHFEKNRYLPVSLRTGTKRHRFVFEYRFVSTD